MTRRLPVGEVGLSEAAAVLRRGGVVALPTDTFYALAVRVDDAEALVRLRAAKGRAGDKPLPVLVAGLAQAEALSGGLPEAARRLATRWWPGPLTLVVPAPPGLPAALTAGTGTVGLRAADHAAVAALLAAYGEPITGTSANRAGARPPLSADEVEAGLGSAVDLLLDGGEARGGEPSTVVDCTTEPVRVLREGALAAALFSRPPR